MRRAEGARRMVTVVEHAVQVSTALFLVLLGVVVFAVRPGHALNRVLGALLVLRGASDWFYEAMRVAPTARDALASMRIANWFDWPTLLLTVLLLAVLFRRDAPSPALRAGLALAAAVTLALAGAYVVEPTLTARSVAGQLAPEVDDLRLPHLFRIATVAAQAAAVLLASRTARSTARSASERKQAALVGLAFALLLVDAAGRATFALAQGALDRAAPPLPLLASTLASAALAALVAPAIARLPRAFEGRARAVAAALLVAALATGLAEPALNGASALPFQLRARFVWVSASAACLALALARFGLAGMGERVRARAATLAHVALVAGLAALPAGALLAAQGGTTAALVAAILLLLGAFTFSPGPRRALEGAVARLLLVDPADTVAVGERARAYSAALAARATQAGAPRADDAGLAALRRELGLTERDHDDLARLYDEQRKSAPAEPPLLGRYRVERELGRGAFGTALLATDVATGGKVVLKRFHASGVEAAALAEARAMAAVRHPRVLRLLAFERVADEVFLVVPFAEGGSAEALVEREGPLPPERAVAIARDALEGLAAVHEAGLVHGDVKLPNVLIDAEGRGILADLGTARAAAKAAASATLTSTPVIGTLATMAPEALRGNRRSRAGDVYAAGAVLYRLLTGEHYVELDGKDLVAAHEAILYDAPRLPHPRVPARLEAVLRTALAKEPGERFAGAREMREALAEGRGTREHGGRE